VAETVAIIPQQRSIGGILAQVTVRESHRDDLTITEHPVENGANISDHAYKRPSEVEIEVGWDGTQGQPTDFYDRLLQLQAQRMPFTIVTGKRQYDNMLIAGIATVTDQRTEYSFMALVRCRQVNLVSTQSTVVSPQQGAQALPEATTASSSAGTSTLKPAPGAVVAGFATQGTSPTGFAGVQGLPGSPSGPTVTP
jgi:hypothetical protein